MQLATKALLPLPPDRARLRDSSLGRATRLRLPHSPVAFRLRTRASLTPSYVGSRHACPTCRHQVSVSRRSARRAASAPFERVQPARLKFRTPSTYQNEALITLYVQCISLRRYGYLPTAAAAAPPSIGADPGNHSCSSTLDRRSTRTPVQGPHRSISPPALRSTTASMGKISSR